MGYQPAPAEERILASRAPLPSEAWGAAVVALVRATREHREIRVGSSVRGAIDLAGLAHELALARGVPGEDWHVGLDAALVALSGRIRVDESSTRTPEEVIEELYVTHLGPRPDSTEADPDRSEAPPGEA